VPPKRHAAAFWEKLQQRKAKSGNSELWDAAAFYTFAFAVFGIFYLRLRSFLSAFAVDAALQNIFSAREDVAVVTAVRVPGSTEKGCVAFRTKEII